jgi:membrane protease YdiL (CAAX protease family)
MSFVVWLLWRLLQGGRGTPSVMLVGSAIGVSALLFGVGHVPVVAALAGTLTPAIAAYVVIANAAFGLVAGWLYWRRGLESAMLAHVSAHALVLASQSDGWPFQ